jgi:hypothetical protein
MVLGESHYTNNPALVGKCEPDMSKEVVELWALQNPHRFFTGITQVLSGRPKWHLRPEELRAAWDAVVFYNYVPVYVATGPRVRPKSEMFRLGREPFIRLLNELEPDAILVCGFNLWANMLWGLPGGFEGKPWETPSYRVGSALAAPIKHPSVGFSSEQWRPVVRNLLQQVNDTKAG